MSLGTPLRRFGRFRVYWTRRRDPQCWHVRDEDAEDSLGHVCLSSCKASADEAARRLGDGAPVWLPSELLRRSLTLFPEIHRSRLRYVQRVYLVPHLESPWRNGGVLYDLDVTDLTDEGDAGGGEGLWPTYLAGAWPDVAPDALTGDGGRAVLDNGIERGALGRLARGEVVDVHPEWLEDARSAFLLARAVAADHPRWPGAVAALARMEPQFVARYGEAWRSPGGAP